MSNRLTKELSSGLIMEIEENTVYLRGMGVLPFETVEEAYDYFDSYNSAEEDEWYANLIRLSQLESRR